MTRNQIEYWANEENKRHNLELEAQGRQQIANAIRLAQIQASQQAETVRSNLARETETNRANVANEAINVLRLNETVRSNQANEAIGRTNAAANIVSANASRSQASTAARKTQYEHEDRKRAQTETVRSNQAQETIRANSSPWSSIATTLSQLIPRVAERVTTVIDNLKSNAQASRSEILSTWNKAESNYRNAVSLPKR